MISFLVSPNVGHLEHSRNLYPNNRGTLCLKLNPLNQPSTRPPNPQPLNPLPLPFYHHYHHYHHYHRQHHPLAPTNAATKLKTHDRVYVHLALTHWASPSMMGTQCLRCPGSLGKTECHTETGSGKTKFHYTLVSLISQHKSAVTPVR